LSNSIDTLQKDIDTIKASQTNNSVIIPQIESLLQAYNTIKDDGEKNKMLKQILEKVVYIREKRNYRNGIRE